MYCVHGVYISANIYLFDYINIYLIFWTGFIANMTNNAPGNDLESADSKSSQTGRLFFLVSHFCSRSITS